MIDELQMLLDAGERANETRIPVFNPVTEDTLPKMKQCKGFMTMLHLAAKRETRGGTKANMPKAKEKETGPACCECGKRSNSLKKCGKCHIAQYCSEACQKKAWKGHKAKCYKRTKRDKFKT